MNRHYRRIFRLANVLYAVGWRADRELDDAAWENAAALAGVSVPGIELRDYIAIIVRERAMIEKVFGVRTVLVSDVRNGRS